MKKFYVRKSPTTSVYKWSPDTSVKRAVKLIGDSEFCDARPGTQGEDFVVKYVHGKYFDSNAKEHRPAYVECDYVK